MGNKQSARAQDNNLTAGSFVFIVNIHLSICLSGRFIITVFGTSAELISLTTAVLSPK